MEELATTVTIADRPYHLRIAPENVEIIRKAAKLINALINDYSMKYDYQDKQDLLAMVALSYTTNALNSEAQLSSIDKKIIDKLATINKVLEDTI
jgi:cell division protein ZapA (FtsZ GTPase activity inhibitor)